MMSVVQLLAVLYCLGHEVDSLGGLLVSVQSKFTGMDNPKSISWKHGCSGTVVSVRSALTCASCLVFPDDRLGFQTVSPEDLRLYCGDKNPDRADEDPNGQIAYVRAVQIHPEYSHNEMDSAPNEFNFALLITKKRFTIGESLKVLPLYSTDVDDVRKILTAAGTVCFTMTWYFYMNGKPVNENPEWGEIPVVMEKISACRNLSSILLHLSDIGSANTYSCAKTLKGLPICRVDTGSPIVCEGKLVAIVINDRLFCDNDEEHVVMTGINYALPFLTDPELYRLPDNQPVEERQTTMVETGTSSQSLARPESAILVTAICSMAYSIKQTAL